MAPHIKAAGEDDALGTVRGRDGADRRRPGPDLALQPAPLQSRPISGDPGVGSAAARPSVGRQRKASTSRLQLHQNKTRTRELSIRGHSRVIHTLLAQRSACCARMH